MDAVVVHLNDVQRVKFSKCKSNSSVYSPRVCDRCPSPHYKIDERGVSKNPHAINSLSTSVSVSTVILAGCMSIAVLLFYVHPYLQLE